MRLPAAAVRTHRQQARLFRALGHPARIAILSILRDGEQCVCHLEAMLGLRQSAISQHLMVLRSAGLVEDRRDGWNIYYRRTHSSHAMLADALKLITSSRPSDVPHAHAGGACPCPKCSGKQIKPAASTTTTRSIEHA
jgi:ArsR family transcriptional regulator